MPHFRLETNVPSERIPKDFPIKLCGILAKSLGKPINYCAATVIGGVNMSFGGTNEPAGQATLMSIGALGVAENKKHSKALFEAIEQTIGIPPNRMYILYQNSPTSDVGYNGTTFHELFG
ncbi:macrophage migration inhibitory factor homolog [Anthonomus grandis grandis]|uniref:macrophage migration inhibitory factor homolog n=1 Tax=Anthonomus grandis grandis TaxID=2921223 RepID=UPI002166730D|nr:macrophage migration inhibitory factor homolog [Anthonomus grandis grandis]